MQLDNLNLSTTRLQCPAKEYSAYFKKTVVLLEKDPRWLPGALHCDRQGDPYWCIAEEIPRSKDSSGILYMQFDVGLLVILRLFFLIFPLVVNQ